MSNERFDKQIKSKLEDVRPAYNEAAWSKLRASLPLPWYLSLLRDFGGWMLGGLATTAFLGTLYFTYQEKQLNEKLHEEIITLKEIQQQSKTDTLYISSSHTDTIYVVKTIREVVEKPVYIYLNEAGETVEKEGNVSANSLKGTSKISDKTNVSTKASSSNGNVATALPTKETNDTKKAIEGASKEAVPTEQEIVTESPKKELPASPEKEGNVFREKPEFTKDKVEIENKVPVSDILIPERKPETAEEKKKKSFKLPYIHTRVGASADHLGLRIFSIGPSVEAFITNNLSINTGLLIAKPQHVDYKLPMDYNKETGKKFEEQFGNKVPPQHRIEDIEITTSFINLPISMNYYIPTRSNFSFIVNAGTKLNLSVYQEVEFESSLLGQTEKSKFEARPDPKVFNNLFYGMGIQYQYKRVVGQLMPYFDFRFRQFDYMQVPRSFGVNGSVKFDFGR